MNSIEVFRRLWNLLHPFHTSFKSFLVKVFAYEVGQLLESFSLSLVILLFDRKVSIEIWVGVFFALLIYDELFMRLDNAVDWHIVSRHAYPIYQYLKISALLKFMGLEISWHHDHNSGTLVGKVNHGIDKTQDIINDVSWEFMPTLIQVIISLIPLLLISWPTAIIACLAAIIFLKFTIDSNRQRSPLKKLRHDQYDIEWRQGIENVQHVETATIFGQSERLISQYSKTHESIVNYGLEEGSLSIFKYNRLRIRTLTWSRRAILLFWVIQLSSGGIGIPALIYAYSLTERLFHSFWRFARLLDRATEALEGVDRLVTLMSAEPTMEDPKNQVTISSSPSVTFNNVCFSYGTEYNLDDGAIHNLSFNIRPGEIVAIVGPSGAGKTSIRKLLMRLLDIQSGSIAIDGIDIKTIDLGQLRGLIAAVPQGDDVSVFDATLRENIAFGRPTATDTEVIEAAKLAGIHEFILTLPDGYMTLVGERGHKLSGGQKQRIGLARAVLVNSSPIIFFDEATSAVDAITEHEIQENLGAILRGKTSIIIAHRLSTIWNLADRIIVMNNGYKVEEGTHKELMKLNGLYAQMVNLQTTS